ncbi:MAG: hypothetical protein Q4G68_14520 [Planctomycetia bacterium]|nr:hypothetical protein [Planctomycetia bacterium]
MKYTICELTIGLCVFFAAALASGAELFVGSACCDLTPDRPVMLHGQMTTRIADQARTPITANIIAFESREDSKSKENFILVALDVCLVTRDFMNVLEAALADALPEINPKTNLVVAATHTHTSFVMTEGYYRTTRNDIMTPAETIDFAVARITQSIVEAWQSRERVRFSYGLGYATVGWNRRAVYRDGHAVMYGPTDTPDFEKMEGMADDKVGAMFFWRVEDDSLKAMLINVNCPAQVVEGDSVLDADFWHPTRELLHEKYGAAVTIVGLCGPAGDISPHVRFEQEAEARMRNLRGVSEMEEIALRIVNAVDEIYPCLASDRPEEIRFEHKYKIVQLPQQIVSKELYDEFKANMERYKAQADAADDLGASGAQMQMIFNKRVVDRYEKQQGNDKPTYDIPVHVFRIGNSVFCTNPFELYVDFGVQIKSRSEATQTFLVQLAAPLSFAGYLPSEYATSGGGYGAIPQTNYVGAQGGAILVDETVKMIDELFADQ